VKRTVQRGTGYQFIIFSRFEEHHGKPSSSWSVAGPSGCKLTSSQQSGIKYTNPDISLSLAVRFFEKKKVYMFVFTDLSMCIPWTSTKHLCITFAKRIHAYTHILN
jgi:hypothetical protein